MTRAAAAALLCILVWLASAHAVEGEPQLPRLRRVVTGLDPKLDAASDYVFGVVGTGQRAPRHIVEEQNQLQTSGADSASSIAQGEGAWVRKASDGGPLCVRGGATGTSGRRPFFFTFWTTDNDMAPRYWRSVESVLFHHPDAEVVVYSNSLPGNTFDMLSASGCDVSVRPIELKRWARHTSLEAWTDRLDEWKQGPFFYAHLADAMRLAVLHESGGTYFDTDIIFVNPITPLRNAVGLQETPDRPVGSRPVGNRPYILCNALMTNFDAGNAYVAACAEEWNTSYDMHSWDWNGPMLLTRVWQEKFLDKNGTGVLTVLDTNKFFMLDWTTMDRFFLPSTREFVERDMERLQHDVFAIHLWNKITAKEAVGDASLVRRLLDDFCLVCLDGV